MPSTHTNQVPAPHDVQTSAEAAPTASDHVPSLHEIQSSLDKARRVLDQEPGRPNHNKKKKTVLQWLLRLFTKQLQTWHTRA